MRKSRYFVFSRFNTIVQCGRRTISRLAQLCYMLTR